MSELQEAADTLREIGWSVSIFGSARIRPDSPYYALAENLGARLAKAGLTVIAGGGPGIMEAANKGAFEAGGTSIGLNIKLPHEAANNHYQTRSLHFDYFYSRKATFFMHSAAYIVLPGGWGTMDEVFEVMTLVQTRKIPPAPIILMGSSYWNGLIDWMREQMLASKYIGPHDIDLLTITDDIGVALSAIETFCAEFRHEREEAPALPE
ncbi:TIGR00730 family Rossman fold protein [Allopusillimonas soli]|uniref:Cytokinin riboside 5'-monophosphate phosphoribohydrolase n=1 Tax=Allopusillimonas soli TaxID=659016 RepID=A0A853FEV4_9BURK|nr:TIGR00730 family Rossman fold protein [Allopusillimonas soli]NYT38419.1 TIGR00730 family Rossman fold protein [Allopusillimonas soli]